MSEDKREYEVDRSLIDKLTDEDIQALVVEHFVKFQAVDPSPATVWAMAQGYQKGITRGLQLAQQLEDIIIEKEEECND